MFCKTLNSFVDQLHHIVFYITLSFIQPPVDIENVTTEGKIISRFRFFKYQEFVFFFFLNIYYVLAPKNVELI